MNKKELWMIRGVDKLVLEKLKGELSYSDTQLKYLINRGLDTKEKILKLGQFSKNDVTNVRKMKDFEKFEKRIEQAMEYDEAVTIYGDYDVDGITGTSILVRGLRLLGLKPNYFINNRFEEGFGINPEGIKNLVALFPKTKLIITVDNGIAGVKGVEVANELGIDILITDHHEPNADGILPQALAVIDAKRPDEMDLEFKSFCGAGLAYKIMKECIHDYAPEHDDEFDKALSLVALGTVCDVMPMVDENYYFTKEGLRQINCGNNYPVWAILKDITNSKGVITETTFGYSFGPMLNALGRLEGRPLDAVELMISDNEESIREIGNQLKEFNEQRKQLSKSQQEDVELFLHNGNHLEQECLIVYGEYHEGIAGILAGKIKEKYYKPSIVLCKTEDPQVYKGSARSVPNFNIKDALDQCEHLLLKYGGHAMAAGLSIHVDNIPLLNSALEEIASDECFYKKQSPVMYVDLLINAEALNYKEVRELQELAPFGPQFEAPVIGLVGGAIGENKILKDKHIKIVVKGPTEDLPISILGWNASDELLSTIQSYRRVKGIGNLEVAFGYNGKLQYSFILKEERLRHQD